MQNDLSKLVDELERVESQIDQWFEDNISCRLSGCRTTQEVRSIIHEVSLQCHDTNGHIRDIPSSIHLAFCCKISGLIDLEDDKAQT